MTWAQAMFLAVLQGFSELFPISSLGHTVIIPALLRWQINRDDPTFLAFVVVLHLGTAIALIVFYWGEWVRLTRAFVTSIVRGKFSGERDERVAWLLVAGSIPVGLLGVLFEKSVRALFASPLSVGIFLALNGLVMFAGEALRRRQHARPNHPYKAIDALPYADGIKVGTAQALALLPGISRSGSSMVAGLLVDLDNENAAHFSFLLATPIIFLASVLEIPELFAPGAQTVLGQALIGGVLAGVTAYLSVAFLTKYFETNDLRPFGWYCLLAGIASAAFFALRGVS